MLAPRAGLSVPWVDAEAGETVAGEMLDGVEVLVEVERVGRDLWNEGRRGSY